MLPSMVELQLTMGNASRSCVHERISFLSAVVQLLQDLGRMQAYKSLLGWLDSLSVGGSQKSTKERVVTSRTLLHKGEIIYIGAYQLFLAGCSMELSLESVHWLPLHSTRFT
jgi:hypothetical protein